MPRGAEVAEALQSCLPHQLDLRTGQLWADGQSMLQLHQQRQAARTSTRITNSLVLPPDSEIVAAVSIRSPSGIQPVSCSLIEPKLAITENYGVLLGRTLVDASEWSASVLLVNLGSDVVVLPSFSCVVIWYRCRQCRWLVCGDLVPVSAVSVGVSWTLPEHLEDIFADSHPSLGVEGQATLRNILHQLTHVFPAPGNQ